MQFHFLHTEWVLAKPSQAFTCLLEGKYWIPLSSTKLIRGKKYFLENATINRNTTKKMLNSSKNLMAFEAKKRFAKELWSNLNAKWIELEKWKERKCPCNWDRFNDMSRMKALTEWHHWYRNGPIVLAGCALVLTKARNQCWIELIQTVC